MLILYVGLVSIVIQILEILGTPPVNHHMHSTTVDPLSILLNKFHQNDFKVIYERTELARSDKRYANCQFRTFKYNRTTPVTNCTCILHVDVGYDGEVVVQAYKLYSNEYRLYPIRFEMNFCQAVASSTLGLNSLITNGNLICPIVKERKYYVNNFQPDEERFPPFIPSGHYNLELQFIYKDKEFFAINNYGIVDRPIPIPDS